MYALPAERAAAIEAFGGVLERARRARRLRDEVPASPEHQEFLVRALRWQALLALKSDDRSRQAETAAAAFEEVKRLVALAPHRRPVPRPAITAHEFHCQALVLQQRRYRDAFPLLRRTFLQPATSAPVHRDLAAIFAQCAIQAQVDQALPEEQRLVQRDGILDEALAALERGVELGYADSRDLRENMISGPVRRAPRFAALVAQLEAD